MKAAVAVGTVLLLLGGVLVGSGLLLAVRLAGAPAGEAEALPTVAPTADASPVGELPPAPVLMTTPAPTPTPRSTAGLELEIAGLVGQAGAEAGVSLIELAGGDPVSWSLDGDQAFVAASTYKLPLLMMEAQNVAAGKVGPDDQLCYDAGDWEDGYYSDYEPGSCFSRADLERRVGIDSDNTAAHILVRYDGGAEALNAYARAHGATQSAFYDPNVTTSSDLARLWQNEAQGSAGGAHAQAYLYPLLTHTSYEEGIPAGVPPSTTVVHKIGDLDSEVNDAALVLNGPRGSYVLVVCTDGGSWQLIAQVAQAVSQFEAS
jgi:beta-lactamase class A